MYEALAERLRRAILDGAYKPGEMLGSEYGLSREESISRMTVRRASALLLNEGLIERRPGKGLFVRAVAPATRTVQFVAGNLDWEPSARISRGMQEIAKREGLQVQRFDAHGDLELNLQMLLQLPASPVCGAVILSLHSLEFNDVVSDLARRGFPFVLVDQRPREFRVASVTADNYAGGYRLGQELLGLGHRRVAFIGDLIASTVSDRLAGLRDAHADAGLPFDRSLVLDLTAEPGRHDGWSQAVDAHTRRAMVVRPGPTAMVCSCDAVARAVYRTLASLGLCIPVDVSVVGFDDDPLAEWLTPPLTTIHQPFVEMGRAAMELLCARTQNPALPPEDRVLPVEYIARASIAPPRKDRS